MEPGAVDGSRNEKGLACLAREILQMGKRECAAILVSSIIHTKLNSRFWTVLVERSSLLSDSSVLLMLMSS